LAATGYREVSHESGDPVEQLSLSLSWASIPASFQLLW